MELTERQREILNGVDGPFLAQCMRWLVEWGRAMGARRLVPVTNTHALVTVPGNLVRGAGAKSLEQSMTLLRSACRHRVACHSTTHIAFAHEEQYDEIDMPAEQVAAQQEVMEMATDAGFLMTLTCAPYLVGNVPLRRLVDKDYSIRCQCIVQRPNLLSCTREILLRNDIASLVQDAGCQGNGQ